MFKKLFKQTATRLEGIPNTHVYWNVSCITPAAKWAAARQAQQEALQTLPADFADLYQHFFSCGMDWSWADPQQATLSVRGRCDIMPPYALFWQEQQHWVNGRETMSPFWDKQLPATLQAELRTYYQLDNIGENIRTIWRPGPAGAELALYLGGDRLHPLPFSPLTYVQTGIALGFLDLWQLFFIPAGQQAPYATALATLAEQVRRFFPAALPLLPPHVAAYTQPLALPPGPDYRQLVQQAHAFLQTVEGVQITQWGELYDNGYRAATLATFEQVRWATGRPVPHELLAFYGRLNGCWLAWQWPEPDLTKEPRGGSLRLWPLEKVFGGQNYYRRLRWDDHIHDGDLWAVGHTKHYPEVARLRPFEQLNSEYYPCLQLPFAEDPAAPVDISWLTGDLNDVFPLQLSFTDYLAHLFACLGVSKWQFFYRTDKLTYESPGATRQVEQDLLRLGIDPAQALPDRLPAQ